MSETNLLHRLCHQYGIQTAYYDMRRHREYAPTESLLALLRSLGAPVATPADAGPALREHRQAVWQRPLEPVIVDWDGAPSPAALKLPSNIADSVLECRLKLETGEVRRWQWDGKDHAALDSAEIGSTRYLSKPLPLPHDLSRGYHHLEVELAGRQARSLVISAPKKAYSPPGEENKRAWGVFLPLYALRTNNNWGSGNFSDLEALAGWVAGLGGQIVATLPLLAGFFNEGGEPSPYLPVSRLFWNEFYIDPSRVPELEKCPEARRLLESSSFREEVRSLRNSSLVDYPRQMALKRRVIEEMSRSLFDGASERLRDLQRFIAANPAVEDYARFRATSEKHGTQWQSWPEQLRGGSLSDGDYREADRRYHLYGQWLAHQQVTELGRTAREKGQKLYLDLPVGVHPDGYDAWRESDAFIRDASAGAPPDTLFTRGQDWGFPPLHPENIREQGYRYPIAYLRHHLQQAGILRVDHVMGFHRIFCIPRGMTAGQGVYLRYRAEEFYAILALESHRNRAVIVGEDLGIVPSYVRPAMKKHGLHRMYVLRYEVAGGLPEGMPQPAPSSIASLNTHDMPPFAAFWQGGDIAQRRELGLLDETGEKEEQRNLSNLKRALLAFLRERGWLAAPEESAARIIESLLSYLAASRAEILLVNLEDLWQETLPQNIPGTVAEHPNWRRKTRYLFEEFCQMPGVVDTLKIIDRKRRNGGQPITQAKNQDTTAEAIAAPPPVTPITDDDLYLFNEGSHFRLYQKLGAKPMVQDDRPGTRFAVWAPDARRVSVTGDFNGWNKESHPLHSRGQSGIWEGFVPGVTKGATYKYHIVSRYRGYRVDKADPLAFYNEIPPKTASIVWDTGYAWGDREWMEKRGARQRLDAPMAIYEVHLGSWRRVPEDGNRSLGYREMAAPLAEHVRQMGFTHVEFLPVMEHPFFGSWGYQTTGYFAPSARYGTPQDFMYLVDYLHQRDIGVILDWVPSHFPTDEHSLGFFDGTHLYEHADHRKGFHPDWKSSIFNYGRPEVRSFLISSALFWLDQYHADGLRVDAVASMLYLDYSRKEGEWLPNKFGGRENLEAITFLRRFNEAVYQCYPDVQTIAEESTAWPMVSRPTYLGGLGFGLKWDMGWMHDTLQYMSRNPIFRKYHHNDLTFRMLYAFTENFVLPLSHDEVVHGKGSLLSKMPGDDWQKYANLRLLLGYTYGQPGKKLLFAGTELAQWQEWRHDSSLDWHLLQYQHHADNRRWLEVLNRLYRGEPALYELDCEPGGFEWIDASDVMQSVVSFFRRGKSTDDILLFIGNFTPATHFKYRVGVPRGGTWQARLNSDDSAYGGSGQTNPAELTAAEIPAHGRPYSLEITLPPLAIVCFKSPGHKV